MMRTAYRKKTEIIIYALLLSLFLFNCSIQAQLQSDSTSLDSALVDSMALDTSDYVGGDIHFNLIVAAYKGYSEEVLRLLNKGAYVDYRSAEGLTPLMYAVQNGNLVVAKTLLLNGAKPDLKDYEHTPPLITAIEFADLNMAELLIRENANINIRDKQGRTAMMLAVANGFTVIIDMLLYYEADVNSIDYEGNTALNVAALTGDYDILKLLAAKKSSLEKADKAGFTPMHSSAQEGHIDIIKYLVEQGANSELKTKAGHTVLSMAVMNEQVQVVEYLVNNNANVNASITGGIRPMNLVNKTKNDSIINILKSKNAVTNRWPAFHYTSINLDFNGSADDFFFGGSLGLHDTKYNLSASAGYANRLVAKAILDEENSSTFYQYWERRSYWYLGANKRFRFSKLTGNNSFGATVGCQVVYTYGKYRGSSTKVKSGFHISPQAGLYLQTRGVVFSLNYEYLNFKIEKVSPHRFKFSFGILIPDKYTKNNTSKELWKD